MKKIILIILISGSIFIYSDKKTEKIESEIKKIDKTEEDKAQVEAWNKQINEEYNAYVDKRGKEEVQIDTTLSEDDFAQIIEVNAGNDVEINGTKLNAADFLEVLYSLFVA